VRRLHHKLARWLYARGPRLMSRLRKRWVLLRNPQADIRFTEPVYLGPRFSLHMPDGGTFAAGPGVEFRRGFRAEIGPAGRVEIGAGTVFTYDVVIQCSTSVTIGEYCVFAHAALVVDGSHRFRDIDKPVLAQGYDFRPIAIGDHAAVMAHATVIADLGERAFVGANAVVTAPVPAYSVAVGQPARVIDFFGPGATPDGAPSPTGPPRPAGV
jgi:acetyltransferase-like isoleucine patch superfamily enzyme